MIKVNQTSVHDANVHETCQLTVSSPLGNSTRKFFRKLRTCSSWRSPSWTGKRLSWLHEASNSSRPVSWPISSGKLTSRLWLTSKTCRGSLHRLAGSTLNWLRLNPIKKESKRGRGEDSVSRSVWNMPICLERLPQVEKRQTLQEQYRVGNRPDDIVINVQLFQRVEIGHFDRKFRQSVFR